MHICNRQNSEIGSLFKYEELPLLMSIKRPKMRQIPHIQILEDSNDF